MTSDREEALIALALAGDEEAAEALIDEAASVSVEEAEAYLTAAGFDVAEERARAEAFLHALEHPELSDRPPGLY